MYVTVLKSFDIIDFDYSHWNGQNIFSTERKHLRRSEDKSMLSGFFKLVHLRSHVSEQLITSTTEYVNSVCTKCGR